MMNLGIVKSMQLQLNTLQCNFSEYAHHRVLTLQALRTYCDSEKTI